MITAIVMKPFNYLKVHPVLEVKLGLAPANGMTTVTMNAGDVMEFETEGEFEEMQDIARKGKGKLVRQYRLASNEMCNAPGVLAWAQNGYKFARDRAKMINVMMAWGQRPELTPEQNKRHPDRKLIRGLLDGSLKHRIEGGTIVFPV